MHPYTPGSSINFTASKTSHDFCAVEGGRCRTLMHSLEMVTESQVTDKVYTFYDISIRNVDIGLFAGLCNTHYQGYSVGGGASLTHPPSLSWLGWRR